jgi:hypothetical protein
MADSDLSGATGSRAVEVRIYFCGVRTPRAFGQEGGPRVGPPDGLGSPTLNSAAGAYALRAVRNDFVHCESQLEAEALPPAGRSSLQEEP